MPAFPPCASKRVSQLALFVAASLLCGAAARAQEVRTPAPTVVPSNAPCLAHEDVFRALKVTRARGFVRVDYQFIAGNETRWANMDADLVRKLKVRVGETFCMTRDTGSAESTATDFD